MAAGCTEAMMAGVCVHCGASDIENGTGAGEECPERLVGDVFMLYCGMVLVIWTFGSELGALRIVIDERKWQADNPD